MFNFETIQDTENTLDSLAQELLTDAPRALFDDYSYLIDDDYSYLTDDNYS